MRLTRIFTPAVIALAITMTAGPALAQSDRGDKPRRSADRSARAAESNRQGRDTSAARSGGERAVRRTEPRADVTRDTGTAQHSQPSDNRTYNSAPRGSSSDNRAYSSGQYAAGRDNARRYDGAAARSYDNRGRDNGQYANRGYDNRQYSNRGYNNGHYPAYGHSGYYGYGGPWWRSHVRFGLGVSIFAGSPFSFRFEYGWRPRFTYLYPMRPGVAYGGMSFLLNPDYAEVYIDGQFVGNARDFGGEPVPVAAGVHRIELYAEGFEPLAFDVTVFPGQVIPYRGSLYQAY